MYSNSDFDFDFRDTIDTIHLLALDILKESNGKRNGSLTYDQALKIATDIHRNNLFVLWYKSFKNAFASDIPGVPSALECIGMALQGISLTEGVSISRAIEELASVIDHKD